MLINLYNYIFNNIKFDKLLLLNLYDNIFIYLLNFLEIKDILKIRLLSKEFKEKFDNTYPYNTEISDISIGNFKYWNNFNDINKWLQHHNINNTFDLLNKRLSYIHYYVIYVIGLLENKDYSHYLKRNYGKIYYFPDNISIIKNNKITNIGYIFRNYNNYLKLLDVLDKIKLDHEIFHNFNKKDNFFNYIENVSQENLNTLSNKGWPNFFNIKINDLNLQTLDFLLDDKINYDGQNDNFLSYYNEIEYEEFINRKK